MSQASTSKSKDNGKKYASFNLNQTYKGSKGENKSAAGQGPRHGLQSLGKIGQSRRVLQPAILPSLKSENSGNDPRINLVPSGSQGWGKKQIATNGKPSTSASVGGSGTTSRTVVKPSDGQEISLRPNAGVAPTKIQVPINSDSQENATSKPTWVNKVQQQQPVSGSSVYFQREFPKLVGDEDKEGSGQEQAQTDEKEQDLNRPGMGHPAMINGPKFIDTPQGPMLMPPFHPQFTGDRQMFNGSQQPYPYPYPMFQAPGGRGMPIPYPYPFPQYGGKMPPFDPRFMTRMGKPPTSESSQSSERPLTIKDSDLQALDDDKDDTGWAGAQEEVDYDAKLKFDESDDSEEEFPVKVSLVSKLGKETRNDTRTKSPAKSGDRTIDDEGDGKKRDNQAPEGWPYAQGFPPQMQMAYAQQNWRMQFPPNYDPQRQPPPGPHGYPMHPMFYLPYGFPQGMPPQTVNEKEQAKITDNTIKDGHDEKRDIDKKADKKAKLREVEERMKKREEEEKNQPKRPSVDHIENTGRRRNDSEASDCARRGHSKDVPPRFQRQRSGQQDVQVTVEVDNNAGHSSGPESPQLRIMKRQDSVISNESVTKDEVFKIPDIPDSNTKSDANERSRAESSSLYQETVKKDKKRSIPTESQDKASRSSSTSSVGKTERRDSNRSEKKENSERDRSLPVKELKDFSSSKERENREKQDSDRKYQRNKDDKDHHRSKMEEAVNYADLKSSRSQNKLNKVKSQSGTEKEQKPGPEPKSSPWAKVVSGDTVSTKNELSLKDIQKEEEEEEIRKKKEKEAIEDTKNVHQGHDEQDDSEKLFGEGKFRSDNYNNRSSRYNRDERFNRSDGRNDRADRGERPPRRGRFDDRGQERFKGETRRDRYKDEQYDDKRSGRVSKYEDRYSSNDSRRERKPYEKKYEKKDMRRDNERRDNNRVDNDYRKDNERRGNENRRGNDNYRDSDNRRDGDSRREKDGRREYDSRREGFPRRVNESIREKDQDRNLLSEASFTRREKRESQKSVKEKDWDDDPEVYIQKVKDAGFEKKNIEDTEIGSEKEDISENKTEKLSNSSETQTATTARPLSDAQTEKSMNEDSTVAKANRTECSDFKKLEKDKQEDNKKTNRERRDRRDNYNYKRDDSYRKGDSKKSDNFKRDSGFKKDENNRRDDRKPRRKFDEDKYDKHDKDRGDSEVGSRRYPDKRTYDAGRRNKERNNRENRQVEENQKDFKRQPKEVGVNEGEGKSQSRENESNLAQDSIGDKEVKRPSGGFGVPPPKKDEGFNKSDTYESRKYSKESRGRGPRRGSSSSRASYQGTRGSSRKQGDFHSESRTKSQNKDDLYEDMSSGEFSDSSESKEHTKFARSESRKSHNKNWENETPPRFQGQASGYRGRGRGRSSSERGGSSRGRGRGRGTNQSASTYEGKSISVKKERSVDEKADDDSGSYYSANEAASSGEEKPDGHKPKKTERTISASRSYSTMKKGGYKPGRGGSASASGVKKSSSSFLLNRQQAGSRRTSYKGDKSLSAADKLDVKVADVSSKVKEDLAVTGKNIPETTSHAPQKKQKTNVEKKEEKKRDITREYDLNNIAGVVCVDNLPTNKSVSDDDGFVTVTSKKQQKEMRGKQREEEKRKLIEQQKREAIAAQKAQKAQKISQKTQVAPKTKQVPFADAPISGAVTEQIGMPSTSGPTNTATSTTVTAPASNAAMAAIGAWEPAQSLMRNAQVTSTEVNQSSLAASSSVNAWQRPLSLTTVSPLPDPRAVGTGKPSSSHTIMSKSTLPTPESASPLVTPTAPTPIGASSMSKVPTVLTTTVLDTQVTKAEEKQESATAKKPETEEISKTHVTENKSEKKGLDREQKKETKVVNKRQTRDRAPRFSSGSSRKENSDHKSDDNRKSSSARSSRRDEVRSNKSSAERQSKRENTRSSAERKSDKRKTYEKIEKQLSEEIMNDNVFTNEPVDKTLPTPEIPKKSTLSDADKVVGSNKPSLKSQSSVGSFTAQNEIVTEETLVEVNIRDSFQAPDPSEPQVSEEELSAKDTARSVIKSLGDEEERSLETRSLPGTPPLAVKIPEPTLSGPSSDPGRAPSPSAAKALPPSMAQEVSEMNRRLLYARKAWDDTPTTWSDPGTTTTTLSGPALSGSDTTVSTIKEVQSSTEEVTVASSTATSEKLVVTSAETISKPPEEKTVGNFNTKRSEQQVCKVKPQQQVLPEEIKTYQVSAQSSSMQNRERQNVASKFNSYVLPSDRTGLYESTYNDPLRQQQSNPTLNFHSLNHVRSLDNSTSSISQPRDYLQPVGNVYQNNIQVSQNQFWQVVSSPTVQNTKNPAYQTHNQGSLFTAPGSLASSQLMLQYGSSFAPQRNGSSLPNQHMSVMQVNQAQQAATTGRVVGMLSTANNPQQVRRDQQHYAGIQGTSETLLNNGAQMALLLDPNQALSSQHITSQQRSDMMKHIHAKPFEPNSQTPPLMQSPPVIAQPSVPPHAPAQPIVPTVFSQPVSSVTSHNFQNVTRFQSQPLLQQPQRQGSVQQVPHQNQLVASVRPRSIQGHSLTAVSPPTSLSNQDPAIFPFDAIPLAKTLAIKPTRPLTQNTSNLQHMQMSPIFSNQYMHIQPQAQRNLQNRALTVTLQNRAQPGPGPIQRPSHNQGSNATQPVTKVVYPTAATQPGNNSSVDGEFRKNQRQKMLDDTKKYFQQEQQDKSSDTPPEKPINEEKSQTPSNLSKHDKLILPTNMKDPSKKYDYKKNHQRNASTDNYKTRNSRHKPRNDTAKSMKLPNDTTQVTSNKQPSSHVA